MQFPRLIAVFFGLMLACGGFGATVGGLLGLSLPERWVSFVDTPTPDARYDSSGERLPSATGDPEARPPRDRESASGKKGAAFGGALGLLLGVVLGVPIALLDQALLIGRTLIAKRARAGPEPT